MLELQRTVGNIAVCSWVRALQRQPATDSGVVIGVHLTPAQIAKAHHFYAAHRARYSATLISDIQKAVVIAAEQELARAKKNGDPGAIRVAEARREQARKEHDALATETDAVLTEQTIFDEW